MDIEHPVHEHKSGTYKMVRLYKREKVNGKYQFIPDCWRCVDCGQLLQ